MPFLSFMVLSYQSGHLRSHEPDAVCGQGIDREPLHLRKFLVTDNFPLLGELAGIYFKMIDQ
jgi:hypothetical protein